MGLICRIAGHVWQSGYCRRCGASHKEHQWEQIPGKCAQRCSVCAMTQNTPHNWEVDPVLLAQIAKASDNVSIVNEIKKKFICLHCGAPFSHYWEGH